MQTIWTMPSLQFEVGPQPQPQPQPDSSTVIDTQIDTIIDEPIVLSENEVTENEVTENEVTENEVTENEVTEYAMTEYLLTTTIHRWILLLSSWLNENKMYPYRHLKWRKSSICLHLVQKKISLINC